MCKLYKKKYSFELLGLSEQSDLLINQAFDTTIQLEEKYLKIPLYQNSIIKRPNVFQNELNKEWPLSFCLK